MPAPNPASILIREPGLTIPGKKPVGPVKIDWTNSITRGLLRFYLFRPVFSSVTYELVTNEMHSTTYTGTTGDSYGINYVGSTRIKTGLIVTDVFPQGSFIHFYKHALGVVLTNNDSAIELSASISASSQMQNGLDGAWNYLNFWDIGGLGDGSENAFLFKWNSTDNVCRAIHNKEPNNSNGICTASTSTGEIELGGGAEGGVKTAMIFNRYISDGEYYEILNDPYQFLIPA